VSCDSLDHVGLQLRNTSVGRTSTQIDLLPADNHNFAKLADSALHRSLLKEEKHDSTRQNTSRMLLFVDRGLSTAIRVTHCILFGEIVTAAGAKCT